MSEEDREELEKWGKKLDEKLSGSGDLGGKSSREYDAFQEAEERSKEKNWYEKLTSFCGGYFRTAPFEDMEESLEQSLELLKWDVEMDTITPTGIIMGSLAVLVFYPSLLLPIPLIFKLLALALPLGVFVYLIYYPVIAAKRKVITGSGDLVMAVLYMVVYMRSSPNMEGAVSFVASNMVGPIAKDFRGLLWSVQTGKYSNISQALDDYKEVWRPHNKPFVESVNILQTALRERGEEKRLEMFSEAIDTLLSSSEETMKEYSRSLKTPVMVIQGMGVLLPVLLMILFPLMSAFMGGGGLAIFLFAGYNIILPSIVYIVMRQVLLSRPPTTSTTLLESNNLPATGWYRLEIGGYDLNIPLLPVAIAMFLAIGYWPLQHYAQVIFGAKELTLSPSVLTIVRSLTLTLAAAISAGFYLLVGYSKRVQKVEEIESMEEELPEALFMLGDALSRGQPMERAVDDAIENTQGLDIQEMFSGISNRIRSMGMTFEQAVFDENNGILWEYPSNLLRSIMNAVRESMAKGPRIVSSALKTISNYLKSVTQTQRKIQELLEDTLSTMIFIAYILAPIVSGVAVGMGVVITKAFSKIGNIFSGFEGDLNATASDGGAAPGGTGLEGISGIQDAFGFESAISPEIIQLIVGLYIIQLSFLLGMFYTRLSQGNAPAKQNRNIGKILIVSSILYSVSVLILAALFGSILGQIGGA